MKTLYDNLEHNKENKKPSKEKENKTKENEEKKKQQKQQQQSEKKKQEPKEKPPKSIKDALNAVCAYRKKYSNFIFKCNPCSTSLIMFNRSMQRSLKIFWLIAKPDFLKLH